MESRPGESDTTTDFLAELPPEIQLEIFNLATLQSVSRMQQTCKYYNTLLLDDLFWDNRQIAEFTPTPYLTNNKDQYHTEHLYQQAISFEDADKKQIAALQLQRHLQQQPQQWANYYRGLSFFKGLGVKKNHSLGFQKLLDALDINDYRAATLIARLLVDAKVENSTLFQQLMSQLSKDRQELMVKLILNAYKHNLEPVAKLLGRMHAYGIAVKADFSETERYYLSINKYDTNNICELARVKFDSLPITLSYEQRAAQVVAYLKTFKGKVPERPLQSIINYWTAYLELTRGNNDAAITLLQQTTDFPYANRLHAHLLAENNMPELGTLLLTGIIDLDDSITGELFDMQMQYSTVYDAVTLTKELTNCSMITLAVKVSAVYRADVDTKTLLSEPYTTWWLQLAAQAGCAESLEALQSVDAKQYPLACYALAIIHEFGILHSDAIEPSHDKAEYYFNLAGGIDLRDYITTGQDHKFGCKDVAELLTSKLDRYVANLKY